MSCSVDPVVAEVDAYRCQDPGGGWVPGQGVEAIVVIDVLVGGEQYPWGENPRMEGRHHLNICSVTGLTPSADWSSHAPHSSRRPSVSPSPPGPSWWRTPAWSCRRSKGWRELHIPGWNWGLGRRSGPGWRYRTSGPLPAVRSQSGENRNKNTCTTSDVRFILLTTIFRNCTLTSLITISLYSLLNTNENFSVVA